MTVESTLLVEVERLQLGMYVVLDVGWRHHPFVRNSFTVRTEDQLRQLQSLGPRQIRYCPSRSIAPPLPVAEPPAADPAPTAAPVTAMLSAAAAAFDTHDPLLRQEAALKRVEAEYQQAARHHRTLLTRLLGNPLEARELAEQLSDAMLRWVGQRGEPAVRLLSGRIGEMPSGHEISVSALALLLARECGFSAEAMRETALAALLHDIGKVHVPSYLHEDIGRLTEFERRTYRRHVEFGIDLAQAMELSPTVVRAIAEHHERHDGSGFPGALRGEQLSPAGRVLAIVNRYQGLVCPRQAEAGLTPHLALQRMYGIDRNQFDPLFLPRFVRIMSIYPPGTLVELTDRRMAVVVASRPGMSLSPRVQVLDGPSDGEPTLAFDLDPESGPRVRCGVRLESLNSRWAQRARQLARSSLYIEPLRRSSPTPTAAPRSVAALA
jgi:putative nucleotidyltransferase with HDIG domain